MSEKWEQLTLVQSISSAEASRAKTCPAQERARALLAHAQASGLNLPGSSKSCILSGSSSKTSPADLAGGSTRSALTWDSSGMKRYRSRCQLLLSALLTGAAESSLLPTPSASRYGTGQNGCPGDGRAQFAGKGKPSLYTMASHGTLPTPMGRDWKGPSSEGGKHGMGSLPNAIKKMLPTPTAGDAKASGSRRKAGSSAHAGVSLTDVVIHGQELHQHQDRKPNSGRLSPRFVSWMMGFPLDWLRSNSGP